MQPADRRDPAGWRGAGGAERPTHLLRPMRVPIPRSGWRLARLAEEGGLAERRPAHLQPHLHCLTMDIQTLGDGEDEVEVSEEVTGTGPRLRIRSVGMAVEVDLDPFELEGLTRLPFTSFP